MKKFIIKSLGFFLILILIFLSFLAAIYLKSPVNYGNDFYGVNTDKPNRIILVGSSNIYNNYNYISLNKAFPEHDVIGSHYPLTVGFAPLIANMNLLHVQSKDIVIFCLPYELYDKENFIDFYNEHPQKVLSKQTIREAFKYNAYQTTLNFMKFNPKAYSHYLFEKENDLIDENNLVEMNEQQHTLLARKEYSSCIVSQNANFNVNSLGFDAEYLETFKNTIQKNLKCKVYFRFPPLRKDFFEINPHKIFWMKTNFEFINDFKNSVFDSIYWYNGRYHLNKCGAELNSQNLIEELKIQL